MKITTTAGGSMAMMAVAITMFHSLPESPPAIVVVLMQKWFVKGLVDTEK